MTDAKEKTMKDNSKFDAIKAAEVAMSVLVAVSHAREYVDAVRHDLEKTDAQLREVVRTLAVQAGILPGQ